MRFLFLFTQSPYRCRLSREALDMAMATAAFDQDVCLYFSDNGIYQLIKDQQNGQAKKSHLGAINALPLYDISNIYYCNEDLFRLRLTAEDLVAHAKPATAELLTELLKQADRIQSF